MSRTDLSVQWLNYLNTWQRRLFSVVQTQVKNNVCRKDDYHGSLFKILAQHSLPKLYLTENFLSSILENLRISDFFLK